MRLLCISWYASSASRRLSYSTKANLEQSAFRHCDGVSTTILTIDSTQYVELEYRSGPNVRTFNLLEFGGRRFLHCETARKKRCRSGEQVSSVCKERALSRPGSREGERGHVRFDGSVVRSGLRGGRKGGGGKEEDGSLEDCRGSENRTSSRSVVADVPFEFVGEVAGTRAMAEAGDVESCAATGRHDIVGGEALEDGGDEDEQT